LVIRVLNPPGAKDFVRQIVRRLQDRQPRHQPSWQRRPALLVGVDRPQLRLQKRPIDLLRELHQWVVQIDDLVQTRLEDVFLPAWATLFGTHDSHSHGRNIDHGIMPKADRQLQENPSGEALFWQSRLFKASELSRQINSLAVVHGRLGNRADSSRSSGGACA